MVSLASTALFQECRRRLFGVLLLALAASVVVGLVAGLGLGVIAGLLNTVVAGSISLSFTALWAYQNYRCPSCLRLPMRVRVRAWTKYTRYLRRLQVRGGKVIYPPWAVLFLDLDPHNCPACGVTLGARHDSPAEHGASADARGSVAAVRSSRALNTRAPARAAEL